LTGITKKLFQSPSHRSKISFTNPYLQPRPNPVGRGKTRVNEVRPFIPRVMNLTLPRVIANITQYKYIDILIIMFGPITLFLKLINLFFVGH